jgi:hypothetical protein
MYASPSPAKMDPISNNGNPHRDPPMEASLTRFPWFGSKRDAHHLDQQEQQQKASWVSPQWKSALPIYTLEIQTGIGEIVIFTIWKEKLRRFVLVGVFVFWMTYDMKLQFLFAQNLKRLSSNSSVITSLPPLG